MAIALVLAALLLRDHGKNTLALVCATAAVLSKEPAIVAFPILVFWDQILGRPARRPWLQLASYASVTAVWALIHPGIRSLALRGFQSGATGYVGIEHPERWGGYLSRYLWTLLNISPPEFTATWWANRVTAGLVGLVLLAAGLLFLDGRLKREAAPGPVSLRRIAWIAALLGIPTFLAPVMLIRHWAPYFACIPAVGLAILAGPILARQRTVVTLGVLSVFLLLGVRYRGLQTGNEPVWTERVFTQAAQSIGTLRRNFYMLIPEFPRGSQVLVSVASTGTRGIFGTLIEGQALRVWYRDHTLKTAPPLDREPGAENEYLVRVTTDLDVISIDPDSGRIRATRREAVDMSEIGRPLRNYARAVAADGDVDRGVRVANVLADMDPGPGSAYNHRLAASFLLAAGRRREAAAILDTTPVFTREDALPIVGRILAEPSANERLDEAAFEAFELSAGDPNVIRWIMRDFQSMGSLSQAAWYARRLLQLIPGDPESNQVLDAARKASVLPSREPA